MNKPQTVMIELPIDPTDEMEDRAIGELIRTQKRNLMPDLIVTAVYEAMLAAPKV